MHPARPAFSITAHERPEVLLDQLGNIARFVRDPLVVVHLNRDMAAACPPALLALLRGQGHVRINPAHLPTRWGHMFHAHLSNFRLLCDSGEAFSHFVLLSSADLFFRAGVEEAIAPFDAGVNEPARFPLDDTPTHDEWVRRLRADPVAQALFRGLGLSDVIKDAHEGSFFRREVMAAMLAQLDASIPDWEYDDRYPKEEFFLRNLLRPMQARVTGRISHVLQWGSWPELDRAVLAAVLRDTGLAGLVPGGRLARWAESVEPPPADRVQGVFTLSRIPREPDNPLRLLLAAPGWPQATEAATGVARAIRPHHLLAFERAARAARAVPGRSSPALLDGLEELPAIALLDGTLGAAMPPLALDLPACPGRFLVPASVAAPGRPFQACAAMLAEPAHLAMLPSPGGFECAVLGPAAGPDGMAFLFWELPPMDLERDWIGQLACDGRPGAADAMRGCGLWLEVHGPHGSLGQRHAAPPLVVEAQGAVALLFDLRDVLGAIRRDATEAPHRVMAYLRLPVPLPAQRITALRLLAC